MTHSHLDGKQRPQMHGTQILRSISPLNQLITPLLLHHPTVQTHPAMLNIRHSMSSAPEMVMKYHFSLAILLWYESLVFKADLFVTVFNYLGPTESKC